MAANRLYYHLKPYLPWRFRMALRRIVARRQRRTYQDVWPINEAAAHPPEGWPGWPDGKNFAFVLTHDVEGPEGLAKCRQLMQLDQEFGFRSSFNFIPEGDYAVSRELRQELAQNGFEVGVHDLNHDGLLFSSREDFSEKAQCINRYLRDWGAKGFRSGFMLRNLDWLHELDIQYDCSTFDTDPFEPQPDGVGTIFPFWIPRTEAQKSDIRNGKSVPDSSLAPGYVELPYTLPQDSTLFLMLKEDSADIWKKKLDWIARHGGMALVNVHPDYLNLGNSTARGTYSVEKYKDLLRYVSEKYPGEFWQATTSQVAHWYREAFAARPGRNGKPGALIEQRRSARPAIGHRAKLAGKRAAVLLYSYYATDPRPRREAEALAGAGMEVDVICLRRSASMRLRETMNGVNVFRVPLRRRRSGKLTYAFQYASFLIASFFILSVWRLRKRYDVVHVHNMPDVLVFGALTPRLLGAKVILDLHDPMPELFSSIYNLPVEHRVTRLLKKLEKWSIGFADLVLTPNIAFKDVFVSRGCPEAKLQIIVNSPKEEIFNPGNNASQVKTSSNERPFILMYHGLLVERHGLDLAIRAVAKLRARIPQIQFHVYGETTDYMQSVMRLVQELGLESVVQYQGFKPLEKIAQAISTIDVGLIPNRLNPFTWINLPTRIFEYLAMGKPVIVPRTKGIGDYFQEDQIVFFEPNNADDLASKIEWIYLHPTEAETSVLNGQKVYNSHRWDLEQQRFLALVESLLKNKADGPDQEIVDDLPPLDIGHQATLPEPEGRRQHVDQASANEPR